MNNRVEALKSYFESENLDGYLVSNAINVRYFTGFLGGSRLLIPREGMETLYVHMVNYEAAKEYAKGVEVELVSIGEDVDQKLAGHIKRLKLGRLGFDPIVAAAYLKLKEGAKMTRFKPMGELVWSLRKVKDDEELRFMRKAAGLTSLGMKKAYEIVKPGLSEREVASEIEYAMRRSGSDGVAFDTIVASGARSAFPHGGCDDRKLMNGELVVIDIGAKYADYCADLTRTLVVGQPSARQIDLHNTVMSAQETALRQVKAGIKTSTVDAAARDFINGKGYDGYFVHGLGHGVGLEVHEPPTLNPKSQEILEAGNVVTIEPGVYIPGFGGVRIEDTILVKKDGAEKLTEAPYTLHLG